jgi:hypothetical protein
LLLIRLSAGVFFSFKFSRFIITDSILAGAGVLNFKRYKFSCCIFDSCLRGIDAWFAPFSARLRDVLGLSTIRLPP